MIYIIGAGIGGIGLWLQNIIKMHYELIKLKTQTAAIVPYRLRLLAIAQSYIAYTHIFILDLYNMYRLMNDKFCNERYSVTTRFVMLEGA